jgi:hypothetical protein
MSTEIIAKDNDIVLHYAEQIKRLDITPAVITEWAELSKKLNINGIADVENYKAVDTLRKKVKAKRLEVTKKGKEITEDAKKYVDAVKKEVNNIVENLLAPIETALEKKTEEIDQLKKLEAEKKELEFQNRINELKRFVLPEDNLDLDMIRNIPNEQWDAVVSGSKARYELEVKRLNAEQEAETKKLEERINKLMSFAIPQKGIAYTVEQCKVDDATFEMLLLGAEARYNKEIVVEPVQEPMKLVLVDPAPIQSIESIMPNINLVRPVPTDAPVVHFGEPLPVQVEYKANIWGAEPVQEVVATEISDKAILQKIIAELNNITTSYAMETEVGSKAIDGFTILRGKTIEYLEKKISEL